MSLDERDVALMASTIASGCIGDPLFNWDSDWNQDRLVEASVAIARKIAVEVEKTRPKPTRTPPAPTTMPGPGEGFGGEF